MFEAPIEWVCPESFPDLRRYSHIAIDLETKDPGLTKRGSGALINDGAIVGVWIGLRKFVPYLQQKYFTTLCMMFVG